MTACAAPRAETRRHAAAVPDAVAAPLLPAVASLLPVFAAAGRSPVPLLKTFRDVATAQLAFLPAAHAAALATASAEIVAVRVRHAGRRRRRRRRRARRRRRTTRRRRAYRQPRPLRQLAGQLASRDYGADATAPPGPTARTRRWWGAPR